MKNILIFIFIFFSIIKTSFGQISGPDSVCAGNIYTYNVVIPGADSIKWTFPVGWITFNTTNTQAEVLCNQNIGQICATGFDSLGIILSQQCIQVFWGGSGSGWHVQTQQAMPCQCPNFTASVIPDMGTGCGVCNSGVLSPFLRYAIYKSPWPAPISQFVAFANGVDQLTLPLSPITYYVYLVDITFGIQNAIRIQGGLCIAPITNTFSLPICQYVNLGINVSSNPACIGDTLTLYYNNNFGLLGNFNWQALTGNVTFLPPANLDHVSCIINSLTTVDFNLISIANNCPYAGDLIITPIDCGPPLPIATFLSDSSHFCEGSCTGFQNFSLHATSYQWFFPGGTPSFDTTANPQSVCYFTNGTYDVTLIASNASGSDTTILPGLINVYPQLSFNPISQSGDTLFSTPGYVSYQWYYYSQLIPGANGFYYVAPMGGDYSVIVTDNNGCSAIAYILDVISTSNNLQTTLNNYYLDYAYGEMKLEIYSTTSSTSIIQMIDVFGKEIVQKNIFLNYGINSINFPCKILSSGIYFIKIQNLNGVMIFKFFIK